MKMKFLGALGALFALACSASAQVTITPLPTPPSRADASNFAARADAFLGALPAFGTQLNTAANAAITAAQSAINAPGTTAVSGTSLAISGGSKSLAIQAGKTLMVGQFLQIASQAGPANFMNGQITAYDSSSGALVVNVTYAQGSGTFAAWNVALSTPVDPSRFAQLSGAAFTGAITQGGSQVWHQGNLTNLSQLANGPGYISGINSGMVTGSLGYTPANKAGDTFTGSIAIGDANHYLGINGGKPCHVWAANSFLCFDRANNLADTVISGNLITRASPYGLQVNGKVVFEVDGNGAPFTYFGFNPDNVSFFWVIRGAVVKQLNAAGFY